VQVTESAYPKVSKSTQLRLQAAADRALSEQVAVIRCWRQARSCLEQWTAHASTVAPTLQAVGKKFKSTVDATAGELDSSTAALRQLSLALDAAECARVPVSSRTAVGDDSSVLPGATLMGGLDSSRVSQRGAATVCPLDSLARGSMGKEVAGLVNALRIHKHDLDAMAQSVRTLGVKLSGELRRELDVLSGTEENIEHAVEATQRVLQAPLPGQQEGGEKSGGRPRPTGHNAAAGGQGSSKRVSASGSGNDIKASLASRPAFDLSLS
jgi:hypothetical protein